MFKFIKSSFEEDGIFGGILAIMLVLIAIFAIGGFMTMLIAIILRICGVI